MSKKRVFKMLFAATLLISLFLQWGFAQEYKIYFKRINPEIIDENVWGYPALVRYHVSWNLYRTTDKEATMISSDEVTSEEYNLHFKTEKNDNLLPPIQERVWISDTLEAQKEYAFRFDPASLILHDGREVTATPADEDWVTILTGKETKIGRITTTGIQFNSWKAFWWLVMPVPIDFIFHGQKIAKDDEFQGGEDKYNILFHIKKSYDNSTLPGVIAFGIIDWCFALGIVFLCFSHRQLRLSKVFPYSNAYFLLKRSRVQMPIVSFFVDVVLWKRPGFGGSYDKRITANYIKIKDEWEGLIRATSLIVEKGAKKDAFQISSKEAIHLASEDLEKGQRKLWEEVGHQKCAEIEEKMKKLRDYSIIKILSAGLENLKINRRFLHKSSEEVDRAMENRASSELEYLKGTSFIEWFWNLGALAPLAGLLGTVSGISFAFYKIANRSGGAGEIVASLAPSINEALYTTILGIVVGIFLMLLYYYYKSKLDWIYAKWENIFVRLTERI